MNKPIHPHPAQIVTPGLTGPEGEAGRVTLRAEYYEGQIDLKKFCVDHPQYPILFSNPLVIEPERGSYVFLSKFGAVVFWACSDTLTANLLEELDALPGARARIDSVSDRLDVYIGADQDKVTFNEVWLRELTLDKLKIISLALAQSVALNYFEIDVSRVLARFHPIIAAIHRDGRLRLTHRETLKAIGFAMEVRAAVLDNLTLFDDPPETWESESLAYLDSQLYDQFDLDERLKAINQKLSYLNDVNATFMDLLANRKSHRLEWIIIILILIEILVNLPEIMKKMAEWIA